MTNFHILRQLAAIFHRRDKFRLDDDCCILTAADSNVFGGLQFMYHSLDLSHDFKMEVFDLGLWPEQRAWLESLPNVRVRDLDAVGPLIFGRGEKMWQTWNKPLYFRACPHDRILWIDTDCVVYNDLRPAFDRLAERPVLVKDPADPMVYRNNQTLYNLRPVKQRLAGVYANGGIVGLKKGRDDSFLDEWVSCVNEAYTSPPVRNGIKWFDQGCLNWAVERLGVRSTIWHDHRYCVQGHMGVMHGAQAFVDEKLARRSDSVIMHFAGWNKPWGNWKDHFLVGDCEPGFVQPVVAPANLRVFVLWHDDGRERQIARRSYQTYVDLSKLPIGEYQTNALAETRAYMADLPLGDEEYVGFATARWDDKYRHAVRLENLHHLALSPKVVWAADRFSGDWAGKSNIYHPGMARYLEEMASLTGMSLKPSVTLHANNFICHRDVFEDLKNHVRRIVSHFYETHHFDFTFGIGLNDRPRHAAFLYERATMMYFANRPDLHIRVAVPNPIKRL